MVTLTGIPQVKIIEVSHYLFPEFTKGTVLMKTGVKNEALLNYNSITEEMIFENKGAKLALSQLNQIDTVYIMNRKFVVLNTIFVEQVYRSKYTLYAQHCCSIKDPGKPAAYGGTSQTSATTTYSSYLSGGQVYELNLPEGIETKPFIDYWIGINGNNTKFLTTRQLSKLFGKNSELAKEYLKKHEVKITDEKSLIDFIKYIEAN